MTYKVVLHRSEEGFSVSVPGLPGCCSQGDTEEEAMENIADAIREYLEVAAELAAEVGEAEVREVEVG
jgi:predicted RNase H-like HicB family nuclease